MIVEGELIGHFAVLQLVSHEYPYGARKIVLFGPLQHTAPAAQTVTEPPRHRRLVGPTEQAQNITAQVWVKRWCEFTAGENQIPQILLLHCVHCSGRRRGFWSTSTVFEGFEM